MTQTQTPQFTTIRIDTRVKQALDETTSKNLDYSQRLLQLLQIESNNDLIESYKDAIEQSSDFISLDDFNKEMKLKFGDLE